MARSCYILTDYDCGQRLSLEKGAVRERRARERGEWSCHTEQWSTTPGQGLRNFSSRVSLAGIEPVEFRVESDLRNHQAIVQPRLYDCLMVTQITLIAVPSRRASP